MSERGRAFKLPSRRLLLELGASSGSTQAETCTTTSNLKSEGSRQVLWCATGKAIALDSEVPEARFCTGLDPPQPARLHTWYTRMTLLTCSERSKCKADSRTSFSYKASCLRTDRCERAAYVRVHGCTCKCAASVHARG
jgi:hypothetical protein